MTDEIKQLDEAIKHSLDVAENQKCLAEISVSDRTKYSNLKCAEDHRQLAAWLTELKKYKEQDR